MPLDNLHFVFCTMASLPGFDFSGSQLSRGRFDYADLAGACLRGVSAMQASFWKTKLVQADFSDADLRGADFQGADLRSARMTGCKLTGAVFRATRVDGLDLAGADGLAAMVIDSIDIGTERAPCLLRDGEARAWLMQQSTLPVLRPARRSRD